MPKAIIYVGLVLLILALIPPALIARTRAVHSDKRRIHLVQDMDNQGKFRAQAPAPQLFADGRAMRPPVEGAVARGHLNGSPSTAARVTAIRGTATALFTSAPMN